MKKGSSRRVSEHRLRHLDMDASSPSAITRSKKKNSGSSTPAHRPTRDIPHFEPNFVPIKTFALSPDCSLRLDSTRYAFAFRQMGCHKAGNLARSRFFSGRAPRGYVCQNLPREGVRCWRRHKPAKFFEWHLPSSRS